MIIQYNQKLDKNILDCIKSIKDEEQIDISTLNIQVYYEDIDLTKGLKELFDYCYHQLIERGYKCTKKGSKGVIYYGDLLLLQYSKDSVLKDFILEEYKELLTI